MKDPRKILNDSDPTRLDLGDDLLQTKTISRSPAKAKSPKEAPPPVDTSADAGVEELLVNSKILIGEGFLDEAKATLRRVLRMEPTNLTARDRLEEIQKTEIRRLLGQEESPRSSFLKSKLKTEENNESAESVLLALENEVGMQSQSTLEYFSKPGDLPIFLEGLDKLCAGATAQDRMDLGIGFLEMGLYDVAVSLFRNASQDEKNDRKARGLLATALVAQGKYFDAVIELESLIADQSGTAEEKIDYGYLAGLAQDGLKNFEAAVRWYRAVLHIDPEYRDTSERMQISLKKCAKIPSSSSSSS